MRTAPEKRDVAPRSDLAVGLPHPRTRGAAIGDGCEAGALGAVVVAAWFLLIDTLAGHPFYTPSLLGTALSEGVEAALRSPEIKVGMVYAYTGVHVVLFVLFGIAVSLLVNQYLRAPVIGYLLVVLAVVFELAFLIFILAFAEPLLSSLPWWRVLVGNALALVAMALYFRARYPELKTLVMPVD